LIHSTFNDFLTSSSARRFYVGLLLNLVESQKVSIPVPDRTPFCKASLKGLLEPIIVTAPVAPTFGLATPVAEVVAKALVLVCVRASF